MVRLRLLLTLCAAVLVLPAAAMSAGVDKGSDRPPSHLTNYHKAIWMSEWAACWRPESLRAFARELNMPRLKIFNPQQGARVLSKRAMRFLYEDPAEVKTALEGCRNGILWRFYHEA